MRNSKLKYETKKQILTTKYSRSEAKRYLRQNLYHGKGQGQGKNQNQNHDQSQQQDLCHGKVNSKYKLHVFIPPQKK